MGFLFSDCYVLLPLFFLIAGAVAVAGGSFKVLPLYSMLYPPTRALSSGVCICKYYIRFILPKVQSGVGWLIADLIGTQWCSRDALHSIELPRLLRAEKVTDQLE